MRPLAFLCALSLLAACSKPPCEETCKRVARCKTQSGEEVLGEQAPGPDPTCMKRCAEGSDRFAACEAKKHDCADLKGCLTY